MVKNLLQRTNWPVYTVFILIVVYTGYFSYFTIMQHYAFRTYAYDLGIYMQSMWNTINGNGIFYTFLWEGSRFAAHFEPALFFFLPLYAAWPRAETLLVLQSLVLAMGALPIYLIARDELGKWTGVGFAALYLLYPALHGVNGFDFHGVALAITPLLFSFYMFKRKRYIWGMVFAVLAMMCRETVPLVVIFMAFYLLWVEREKVKSLLKARSLPAKRELIYPLCLILIGATWFFLTLFIIIPHFNQYGGFTFFDRYGDMFQNLFDDAGIKVQYLVYLFVPLALTSLLYPPVLLIALPIFAQNFLSGYEPMYVITNQHTSLAIPWIFVASIYGVKWLTALNDKEICGIPFRYVLVQVMIIFMAIFAVVISPSPIAVNESMPRVTAHDQLLNQVIADIPEDASLYTQNEIFPHICNRPNVYWSQAKNINFFNNFHFPVSVPERAEHQWTHDGNYDFILVDSTTRWSALDRADNESLDRLAMAYTLVYQEDGIQLYQNNAQSPVEFDLSTHVNLLENGSFEIGDPPEGWTVHGTGASYSRSSEHIKTGYYSLKLIREGDAPAIARKEIPNYSDYLGREVTLGVWVWTSEGHRVCISIDDGVDRVNSKWHIGDGILRWMIVSKTIDDDATMLKIELRIHHGEAISCFDGAMLWVEAEPVS